MDDDTPVSGDFVMLHPHGSSRRTSRLKTTSNDDGSNERRRTRRAMLRTFWRLSGCAAKPYREANWGTPWKKAPNDCDHPPTAIQKGGNAAMYLRTMRDVWESVAAHSPDHGGTGSRDEAEQSHSACVHRAATGRDLTPLLSTRPLEHDDAGHAAAEPLLGMLNVQYNLRIQPGRVRCKTCGPGELRGCRREHGSHWGRRDTVPLKVQGGS